MPWHVHGERRLGRRKPSLTSSPWIRGAPQVGFARCISMMRSRISGSSRAPRSAVPAPVQAEALSVPADHGLRADEEESLTPSRPKPRKPGPEHPVGGLKVDALSGALALEDEQLLAKRENLGLQLRARPQQRSNRAARRARRAGCAIEGTLTQRDENINHFNADGNSEGTGAGPPGFTGGSVNGPRRCGGKHKRWRGQRSIAFLPEAITSEGSGDGCTISSDAIWTGSSHIRWGQPDRLHS
jgi:hypothetical protein